MASMIFLVTACSRSSAGREIVRKRKPACSGDKGCVMLAPARGRIRCKYTSSAVKCFLEKNFHALRSRAHPGIVLARLHHYGVNAIIGVVRVMMEKDQFFGAAFHDNIYGFAPMAVPPALLARRVFFRQILCV